VAVAVVDQFAIRLDRAKQRRAGARHARPDRAAGRVKGLGRQLSAAIETARTASLTLPGLIAAMQTGCARPLGQRPSQSGVLHQQGVQTPAFRLTLSR
jgi:hypothetical protein